MLSNKNDSRKIPDTQNKSELGPQFLYGVQAPDYARIILLISVVQLTYVAFWAEQMSLNGFISVFCFLPIMLWIAPFSKGKWVLKSIFGIGLALSIVALLQPSIHGVHRWATVFGIRGHAAMVLGSSSILWFSVRPSSIVRLLCLCVALMVLIMTRSYSLSLVIIMTAIVVLIVAREWQNLLVLFALLLIGAMVPFALSTNRLVRFVEFIQGYTLPFQTAQARNCLRTVIGLGTSSGYSTTLPGWQDDMSFVHILRLGGSIAGAWILLWHGIIICIIWSSRNRVGLGRNNYVWVAASAYYAVSLIFHMLSNATLIPTVGISPLFQGRGLSNLFVGYGIICAPFLNWNIDDDLAGEHIVSQHWMWYCWLFIWVAAIGIILSMPFWVHALVGMEFS